MKKAAKIIVNGTVQGIFFRSFCKEHADKLKLTGFVRNLEDGNLEVVVEGDGDSIKMMIEFLKQGPGHAHIRSVNATEIKWSGDFKEFKILRI